MLIAVFFFTTVAFSNLHVQAFEESYYNVKVDERGSKFNESVEVNKKDNTVIYKVPSHNNIEESQFLFDYTSGLMANRVPGRKECYIQPIPRAVDRSVDSVIKNLRMYNQFNDSKRIPITDVKTVVIKERRLAVSDMNSKIRKFCTGLDAFEVKKVQAKRVKRSTSSFTITGVWVNTRTTGWKQITLNTCKNILSYTGLTECQADKWVFKCRDLINTCIYKAKCKRQYTTPVRQTRLSCEETHYYTGFFCCDVSCP